MMEHVVDALAVAGATVNAGGFDPAVLATVLDQQTTLLNNIPGTEWIPGSEWFPGTDWIPGSEWYPGTDW